MIRLIVAEDDSLLRRTLVELLQIDGSFEVIAQVQNGRLALEEASRSKPDVILTDIDMPVLDGISLTTQIKSEMPDVAVVILSKFGDDENLFKAVVAGASGYVLKDSPISEIKEAIRLAHEGAGHLNPALVARVLSEFRRVAAVSAARKELFAELTPRELEVLELLGKGKTNRAIGEALFLSEKTVKTHVGAVLRKLHVNGRTEAALIAQQNRLPGG